MSLFATTGLESSHELVAFLSSPHQDTRQRGYDMLISEARPLAWGKPIDEKMTKILTCYVESFPRLDHFLQRLDDNSDDKTSNNSNSLLAFSSFFNALRLVICFLKMNKKPVGWISSRLWSHSTFLYRCLHFNDNQLTAIVLSLLTVIVRTGRSAADMMRESFDFAIKPLEKIVFQFKKLPTGEHDRSLWSLRQVYVDFILSLVEFGSFETKEFVVKLRSVIAGIFKLLPRDHPMMQRRVLNCFKQNILDENYGFGPTVCLFSAANIHSIVMINEESGQWTDYLKGLLTVAGEGVCFPVSKPKSDSESLELKNRIALDLLPMLRPLESELQQNLAVSILATCPDTICPYLEGMRFSYDAIGTDRWSALMAFASRILQSSIDYSTQSSKSAYDLCLLDFMPTRPIMNKCLLAEDPMLKVYMITVLMELSSRLHRTLSWMESREGLDLAIRDKLVKDYLRVIPDLQTTMSAYDAICSLAETDFNNVIKTRMNKFMSVLLLFHESDKIDVQRALAQACLTQNKDLSCSFVNVAVSSLAGIESLQFDDVRDVSVSVKQILLAYLLRIVGVPLDKAYRMAAWADENRKDFFECLKSGQACGELDVEMANNTPPPSHPTASLNTSSKRVKRRHYNEPEDWTPKGLFMMFGKDNVYRLLRFGLLTEEEMEVDVDEITDLQTLSNCLNLRPWLGMIAKGMADKCAIDGPFCSLQLPIIIMAMSCSDKAIRKAAYGLMDQVYGLLSNEDELCWSFKERQQIKLLLDMLRNSTEEYGQQQPVPRVLFVAMSAPILCQPSHPMYGVINRLLLIAPSFSSRGIPFLNSLAGSKNAHEQCFKFLCRMYECARTRNEDLPDWQVARLQLLGMISFK